MSGSSIRNLEFLAVFDGGPMRTEVKNSALSVGPDGALRGNGDLTIPFSGARLHGSFSSRGVQSCSLWGVGLLGSFSLALPGCYLPSRADAGPNCLFLSGPDGYLRWWASADRACVALEYAYQGKKPLALRFYPSGYGKAFLGLKRTNLAPDQQETSFLGSYAEVHMRRFPGVSFEQAIATNLAQDTPTIPDSEGWLRETILIALPEPRERMDYESFLEELAVPSGGAPWMSRYQKNLASLAGEQSPHEETFFVHTLHTARCNVKADRNGSFAGFAAGIAYSVPARTYFRDGYWTALALMPFYPELVRKEILFLAAGVNGDGTCPSGVIYPTPAGLRYWEELKRKDPSLARDHRSPLAWWDDHFDAPLFFVILVFDYIEATQDRSILDERSGELTVAGLVGLILSHYQDLEDADHLPIKPRNDRDWADNVFRGGAVTYDIALYYGALVKAGSLDPHWAVRAEKVRQSATHRLWLEPEGYFAEFLDTNGMGERHLALETVTVLYFGLADDEQETRMIRAIKRLLYSRNNDAQPYGEWGTMAVFPPYSPSTRRRGKTRFPYRYHNGADWPYWDAVLAWVLLRRGDPDWLLPLRTFWEYGLSQGWPEPVEYYSPPYGHGSFLQAWSGLAARVIWEAKNGTALNS